MIEIKIPKEITEYKEKFLFGLTVRQFVSIAVALAVCVPLYVFGKDYIGDDVASWLVILIAVPIFGFGFVKFNGMPFEKLIAVIYRQKWAEPQRRKYMELPVFYEWRTEIIESEIAHQKELVKQKASPKKENKSSTKLTKKKGCKHEEEKFKRNQQCQRSRQKAIGKAKKAAKEEKEKGGDS